MGLFINGVEYNIIINNQLYDIQLSSNSKKIGLFSSDNYILKDIDGLYLMVKEETE